MHYGVQLHIDKIKKKKKKQISHSTLPHYPPSHSNVLIPIQSVSNFSSPIFPLFPLLPFSKPSFGVDLLSDCLPRFPSLSICESLS